MLDTKNLFFFSYTVTIVLLFHQKKSEDEKLISSNV